MDLSKMLARRSLILYFGGSVEIVCWQGPFQDCPSGSTKTENHRHKKNSKDTGLYTIVTPSTSPHPTPLERRYEGSSL
jgi:hypothetical protein